MSTPAQTQYARDGRLTLGVPNHLSVHFGNVTYGVEPPRVIGQPDGLDFVPRGCVPTDGGFTFYGWSRGKDMPVQIRRAHTADGITFTDSATLFELPQPETQWLACDVAHRGDHLIMLQSECGTPPTRGHKFHVFAGSLAGGDWRRLSDEHVYRGQDAFCLVRHDALGKLVNYQTTYQPWDKRFADNMPLVRRVLHIRTSDDGLTWTPGGSFGVDGPHLPDDQMIVPDNNDPPDTEFYHFAAVDLDEFWAGIMVKYVSQPAVLPKSGNFPHGPFLGYEWWVSPDGLAWRRPYRDTSNLDGVDRAFAYHLPQPIRVGTELRFPTRGNVYALDRDRMFYAYSRANAEVITPPLALTGRPLVLEVMFESPRRHPNPDLQQGYLMAELLDADGRVIDGFSRDRCIVQPSDDIRIPLAWDGRHTPGDSAGPVALRLLFRDVRLYSLRY